MLKINSAAFDFHVYHVVTTNVEVQIMLESFNTIELIILSVMAAATLVPIAVGLWAFLLFVRWKIRG